MRCIPPNPRRVGYIDPIHVPLYMASHIHQQSQASWEQARDETEENI